MANLKIMVLFPYGGYEVNPECKRIFWKTINKCWKFNNKPVVVVLNKDTILNNNIKSFLVDINKKIEVIEVWSVDTCQMWLAGWGHIIDNHPDVERIVQIPGDIDNILNEKEFYQNLMNFIQATTPNLAIGDFETGDKYSAKDLVDTYGTYPLLANWFPEISKSIKSLPLNRPRSEFINIKASILRELLIKYRKFAYEQTLNFLIRCWHEANDKTDIGISVFPLGKLSDDQSFRQYRGSLDQIERTERMLSLLWREINEPKQSDYHNASLYENEYKKFSDEYDKLYQKSKGMIDSARTTLRALLGI